VNEVSDEMRLKDFPFIVYTPDGQRVATTASFDFDNSHTSETFSDTNIAGTPFRVYRTDLTLDSTRFRLFVFHSLVEKQAVQKQLGSIFLIIFPLTLLLAAIGGSFLAKKALSPVVEMARQAKNISASNLNERLAVNNRHDELGQLTMVINDLLERLGASFEQQKRFMADASHELRTPLAVVRGESEVSLSKRDRSAEEYLASLAIIRDESARLTGIVEDLFTLARADAGQFRTAFSPVYLNDIVSDAARAINVLARGRNITVDVSTNGDMEMDADEPLLRRLFLNLFDNAVKFNRSGGKVSIKSETSNSNYTIVVADTGHGIAPDQQPYIFDRFYRVDKARSRSQESETSGAGLGLAISQWIAEIHRGRINLVSSDETGSIFSVVLPR
jgi:heavy metal sensor kinase